MKSAYIWLVLALSFGWEYVRNDPTPYSMRQDGKLFGAKCGRGKACKRSGGYATIPWDSPLENVGMKISCPTQDFYLRKADLSSVFIPHWIKSNVDPVGRCPVRLQKVDDRLRLWPPRLVSVECACEHSRCTIQGTHTCSTIYVSRPTLRSRGITKELLAVDCVCATQRAQLPPPVTLPSVVD